MSECPSYQAYSQSQKVSIGIFVDAPCPGSMKSTGVSITRTEKEVSNTQHLMKKRGVKASISSTVSKHVDSHTHRTSQEGRKTFMYEQPKQQACLPVNDSLHIRPNEMENTCKESLRMKLREILGAVPSNENFSGNIGTNEVKDEEAKREQTLKHDGNFKPLQSSDTIETDSENVDVTIKKPFTRSLARKRDCPRTRPKKLKAKTVSCDGKGQQGSGIFSFPEKSAASPPCTANFNYLIPEKNDHAKKSRGVEPDDKVSPVTDPRSIQLEKIRGEKALPIDELPLSNGAASPNQDCLDKNQQESPIQSLDFHNSYVAREINKFPNLIPQEKYENIEPFFGHSPLNYVDDLNCQSPKVTQVALDSPMGSDLPAKNKKQHVQESVELERAMVHEAQRLFKNSTPSEKEISEHSDDAGIEYSQTSNSTQSKEKKDAGNRLFIPARRELDSTEEVSISKKVYQKVKDVCSSPEISFFGKAKLFRSKRHCFHGVDLNNRSPSLHARKATENADDVSMSSDDIPENGLTRVASVLGMALEKIKSKMLLVRNRKCSEILMSAAEEINLQLCSVQSQIQSDLDELSSLKSFKRKHLEARLQEQQAQLKAMHEKFKEEICQYVRDCKGAMEGLETHNIELQGAIEKQKALHKKLLSQTEAVVETHLIDANKQMMLVHELEKQKMQTLKLAIAQCLNDIC